MLLTQKCFRRISLTKPDDFHNKTQCTLYGDSWEKRSSDVGAKRSYSPPNQFVLFTPKRISSSCWTVESWQLKPWRLYLGRSGMQFNFVPTISFLHWIFFYYIKYYYITYSSQEPKFLLVWGNIHINTYIHTGSLPYNLMLPLHPSTSIRRTTAL